MPVMSQKCLTPDCLNTEAANCEGLCLKCRSVAKKMVEAGRTSWGQLAAMGLIRPVTTDPFTRAFERKNGE